MNTLHEFPAEREASVSNHWPPNPFNRILLVDDDLANCSLNARLLVRSGYQVDTAEDGQAGWEALQANHYDLLITDNTMPRLSGLELVKRLRAAQMRLPVVLASGTLGIAELESNQGLNIAATVWKPFTSGQLVEAVREALGGARARGEIRFQGLPEPLSHIEPTSHWGLNE